MNNANPPEPVREKGSLVELRIALIGGFVSLLVSGVIGFFTQWRTFDRVQATAEANKAAIAEMKKSQKDEQDKKTASTVDMVRQVTKLNENMKGVHRELRGVKEDVREVKKEVHDRMDRFEKKLDRVRTR